ncbi:hypothetical protein ACWDR9_37550, partial [Streptosporangium sandarakinum]
GWPACPAGPGLGPSGSPARPPGGIPAGAADAAGESVAGAVAAAGRLPAAAGAELLEGARAAFTGGLTTVAWLGAAVFAVLAVVSALAFRRGGAPDAAPASAGTETAAVDAAVPQPVAG